MLEVFTDFGSDISSCILILLEICPKSRHWLQPIMAHCDMYWQNAQYKHICWVRNLLFVKSESGGQILVVFSGMIVNYLYQGT